MMKRQPIIIFIIFFIYLLPSCKTDNTSEKEQIPRVSVKAESPGIGTIKDEISFQGITVYLKKTQVISPISGYVVSTNVKFGQEVQKDKVLFELKTRESKALESANNASGVSGTIVIRASSDGFIYI